MEDVLTRELVEVLTGELKFEGPSEVQEMVYHEVKRQQQIENMIVQSKNGTGKTLAYCIVLVNNLIKNL